MGGSAGVAEAAGFAGSAGSSGVAGSVGVAGSSGVAGVAVGVGGSGWLDGSGRMRASLYDNPLQNGTYGIAILRAKTLRECGADVARNRRGTVRSVPVLFGE
ncbi:hypothetical protein [Streptomyces sp. NPDC102462]|uniref:hypothetical protein n=1 Tax=Streptomyces sp. NPDC102462 TaxID=3366178 RepID=UPI003824BF58